MLAQTGIDAADGSRDRCICWSICALPVGLPRMSRRIVRVRSALKPFITSSFSRPADRHHHAVGLRPALRVEINADDAGGAGSSLCGGDHVLRGRCSARERAFIVASATADERCRAPRENMSRKYYADDCLTVHHANILAGVDAWWRGGRQKNPSLFENQPIALLFLNHSRGVNVPHVVDRVECIEQFLAFSRHRRR